MQIQSRGRVAWGSLVLLGNHLVRYGSALSADLGALALRTRAQQDRRYVHGRVETRGRTTSKATLMMGAVGDGGMVNWSAIPYGDMTAIFSTSGPKSINLVSHGRLSRGVGGGFHEDIDKRRYTMVNIHSQLQQ